MRSLALIFLLALSAIAQDLTQLKPSGYVSDFASVVDPSSKESIERYLGALEKATGAQIAIVTVKTLNGDPIEDAANKLYRQWGIGKKGSNEGALFLFAINERKSRLEVGYGLEPILPDGTAGGLLRAMRPALRQGQYGAAFIETARELGAKIAMSKNVPIPEALPPPAYANSSRSERPLNKIPTGWLFLGAILLFAALSKMFGGGGRGGRGGGFFPWFIPMGGFSSGGGGGGFGSSGGGSSWGGFGGGDSGGGGASSDW